MPKDTRGRELEPGLAAVWLAIERTCHHIDVVRVTGTGMVRAECRCSWYGPLQPPEKAGTWAARDGREHLDDVETRTPPTGWPNNA